MCKKATRFSLYNLYKPFSRRWLHIYFNSSDKPDPFYRTQVEYKYYSDAADLWSTLNTADSRHRNTWSHCQSISKKKNKKSYLFIFALFGFVRVGCYREENSEAQEVKWSESVSSTSTDPGWHRREKKKKRKRKRGTSAGLLWLHTKSRFTDYASCDVSCVCFCVCVWCVRVWIYLGLPSALTPLPLPLVAHL